MGAAKPGPAPLTQAVVDTTGMDPEMKETLGAMRGASGAGNPVNSGDAAHPKNQGNGWSFDWTKINPFARQPRPSVKK